MGNFQLHQEQRAVLVRDIGSDRISDEPASYTELLQSDLALDFLQDPNSPDLRPVAKDRSRISEADDVDRGYLSGLADSGSLDFLSAADNDAIAISLGFKPGDLIRVLADLFASELGLSSIESKMRKLVDTGSEAMGFSLDREDISPVSKKGRKGALSPAKREKAATIRADGACHKCRWEKKSVSDLGSQDDHGTCC